MLEQGAIFMSPHKCGDIKIAKIPSEGACPLVLPGCSVNFAFQRSRQHRRGLVSFARRQKIAKIPSEGACPLVLPGCSVNFAFQRSRQHRRGLVSFARRQKIARIPSEGGLPPRAPRLLCQLRIPARQTAPTRSYFFCPKAKDSQNSIRGALPPSCSPAALSTSHFPLFSVYIITRLRTPARRSPRGSRQTRSDRQRSR